MIHLSLWQIIMSAVLALPYAFVVIAYLDAPLVEDDRYG